MQDRTAVLLLDLQIDFLDIEYGKMPVSAVDALRVIAVANAVLAGRGAERGSSRRVRKTRSNLPKALSGMNDQAYRE